MRNIMLTYRCNLRCPYCFANEFVNHSSTDITLENFRAAVEFLTRGGPNRVSLIGGEPTLHPAFASILTSLIQNPKVNTCTIYTNGLLLNKYFKLLVHPKFRLLVNCNSPDQIGNAQFARLMGNLDELILGYHMTGRINLGINLYDPEMDYSFIAMLLMRYGLHKVRISLTVPDFCKERSEESLSYFRRNKAFLLRFIKDMDGLGVLPYYDCNIPPACIWTEEERRYLLELPKRFGKPEDTLVSYASKCSPVIDILPDLSAVRCFGMSSFEKVKLADFDSVEDLSNYFVNTVDACAFRLAAAQECTDCYHMKTRHCTAGCMGFKQPRITRLNQAADQLNSWPGAEGLPASE